jgi:2-hydroxychromene-2-carboxylate isomerase
MTFGFKKHLQPYAARLISSHALLAIKRQLHEGRRRLLGREHQVDVYLRVNDPYSYLLVQVLADIERRFSVRLQFKTILNLQQDMYPEEQLWHKNAFIDATHLARLYQLDWPKEAPQDERINSAECGIEPAVIAIENLSRAEQASQLLLQLEAQSLNDQYCDWAAIESVFKEYWFQQPSNDLRRLEDLGNHENLDESRETHPVIHSWKELLRENEQCLSRNGHYMSAMLHYGGEWYWGLDRLDHLERRLLALGKGVATEVLFDKTYAQFCQTKPLIKPDSKHKKLILYFSIRSPYSYLGLQQAVTLAQHYQLTLEVKPILPMIMRGLSVPNIKKMYIFHDTKREAQKLGVDYGWVADPLGEGVNRCYSLFNYAQSQGKETEYLLNYAQAVNAQGIHSDTDEGLKMIVERSGLDWAHAQTLLKQPERDQQWQGWAEDNRQKMLALGSWGVPTYQYGDLVLWGQDRVGLIEQAILQQK